MLRKISATEPKLVIVGFVCVPRQSPPELPAEALEVVEYGGRPRPPVVTVGADDGFGINVSFNTPPVCPVPVRKSFFNPLTQQLEYYYDYGRGIVTVPPECGGGFF
jgi:hypothetical protein